MEIEAANHQHHRVDDENGNCTCSQHRVTDLESHLVQQNGENEMREERKKVWKNSG